jgi:hypothetical protein
VTVIRRITLEKLVGTFMGALVAAEIRLVMMVVVVIEVRVMVEIVEWSAVDQDVNKHIWLTLLVSRVQVSMTR